MGVTGAILCGGSSKRMGKPKAELLLPDGRSMIETVRDTLSKICDGVVLLGPSAGVSGHRVIEDNRHDAGPLAGIEALLASGLDDRYLIVPCDQPRFNTTVALRLLSQPDALSTCFSGHPLPCVIDAKLHLDLVEAMDAGMRAVRDWHARVNSTMLEPTGCLYDDVDTPEEFEALCTLLRDNDT